MSEQADYRRHLGLFSAIMLIAGSMIGSGVYIVGADMTRTGSSGLFLVIAWVFTGILTVAGALSYGELAGLYPKAGGQYAYLREVYGGIPAFLYGWTFFLIIECGTIAAVAVGFGKYLGTFFPAVSESAWIIGPLNVPAIQLTGAISIGPYSLGLTTARMAGVLVILFLTCVNAAGIKAGARIQNVFTVVKIASLGSLIVLGLTLKPSTPPSLGSYLPESGTLLPFWIALLVVQTQSLFSADAWNSITFIAAEVKQPRRTIPLSLFIAPALVCGLFTLAHVAYLRVLGPSTIAQAPNDRVGSLALQMILGPVGGRVMAAAILWSMFGCINGLAFSGARVYWAMARDGLFLRHAGQLNRRSVPAFALMIQAIWASLLTLSGTYNQLLDFVMFSALLFYVLVVGGVLILRWKKPELERPVRVPGGPVLPILYILGASAIMVALLIYRPAFTWPGLVLVVLGFPFYFLFRALNLTQKHMQDGEGAKRTT